MVEMSQTQEARSFRGRGATKAGVTYTDGAEVISGRFDVGRALDFTTSFFLLLGNKIWCKKQGTTFAELKKNCAVCFAVVSHTTLISASIIHVHTH